MDDAQNSPESVHREPSSLPREASTFDEADEYDPSKPFVKPFIPAPTRAASAALPGPNRLPPPVPTLLSGAHPPPPPPPPPFVGSFPPFIVPPGSGPPPFLFAPPSFPPPPAVFPAGDLAPPVAALPSPIPSRVLNSTPGLPAGPGKPLRSARDGKMKTRRRRGKKHNSANIQENLRHALYQDEKYTLHEPVWKVVAGQMTRVHFIETSPTELPITKLIATKKSDAIALHKRLLEKSPAAIYYSDGSFKKGWAWGAAVEWTKDGSVGKKLREELGMCDPTDAEMGGMRKALEAFASVGRLLEQELLIFCDSQAAITLVDSGVRYQSQLFISTLERTIALHPNVKVSIVWVPGHVGIAGNELADRTAVAGTTTTVLARRAGRLPGASDAEGDMPVILARKVVQEGSSSGQGLDVEAPPPPTDDTLIFDAGSLFVASFPDAATASDLEVLFGQFGPLASIDIFSIPPAAERYAMLSFQDSALSDEAIKWLDEKPVTLPSRYAESRDCEVWKGWQGSLRVVPNEVGRLVPAPIAALYPSLPARATGIDLDTDGDLLEDDHTSRVEDMDDDRDEAFVPHSGTGASQRPSDPSIKSTSIEVTPAQAHRTPSGPQSSARAGVLPSPVSQDPHQGFSRGTRDSSVDLLIQGPLQPVGPSAPPPSEPSATRASRLDRRSASAPYPHAGNGRPPLPPQAGMFNQPSKPSPTAQPPLTRPLGSRALSPPPLSNPSSSLSIAAPRGQYDLPPLPSPSSQAPPEPAVPTTVVEMSHLILSLKSSLALVDAQHDRVSIVLQDPADWSLAIAHLGKSILNEQSALEGARRTRAKAEEAVDEWEAVLQRNDVGIEERRGFVLDVLDVLDQNVMDDARLIRPLHQETHAKQNSLRARTRHLPPTTASVISSCEDLFTTLHHALEEQRMAIDEAERRSSVLGGLVSVRRAARWQWRGRQEEIGLVVRELLGGQAGPPPPGLASAPLPPHQQHHPGPPHRSHQMGGTGRPAAATGRAPPGPHASGMPGGYGGPRSGGMPAGGFRH